MAQFTFSVINATPVAIPDGTGTPTSVPSLITQSVAVFVSGTITDVNFTLSGLNHSWANDLDLVLFGPNTANNLILMSDVGGSSNFSNTTLTFDDAGSSSFLNDNTSIGSGNYRPTNHFATTGGGNPNPDETAAQFGSLSASLNNPGPTGTATFDSVFTGSATNGLWTFAVSDDGTDDVGSFGTWSLQLQTQGTETSISGTSGADALTFASSSATAGVMVFNGNSATYSGLDSVTFTTGGGLDVVVGGQGSETIIDSDALDGDNFDGGTGVDTIDYSTVSFLGAGYASVSFNLGLGAATSNIATFEFISNFENLIASDTNDTIFGTAAANSLSGMAGNDVLMGDAGSDVLEGGVGHDSLYGGADVDESYGGTGNDQFFVEDASSTNDIGETFDGGDDFDTIDVSDATASFNLDLRDDSLVSIEGLILATGAGLTAAVSLRAVQVNSSSLATNLAVTGNIDPTSADILTFDMTGASQLDLSGFVMTEFGGQNDRVVVQASTGPLVTIFGTAVVDEIHGSNSDLDSLYGGGGSDSLFGEAGDDNLFGGLGADALFGGDGFQDWAWYTGTEDLILNLGDAAQNLGTEAEGDTYDSIEGLISGSGNDLLIGNTMDNVLSGNDGNDTFNGGEGIDWLVGGNDNDVLVGGDGADSLEGGDGTRDIASYIDSIVGLRVDLTNAATNTGFAAGDTFIGIEDLAGSIHNDSLFGNTGGNVLYGEVGNDLLYGGGGIDALHGGIGADNLWGGAGADAHFGGNGAGIDYARYDDANHGNLTIRLDGGANVGAAAVGDTYSGIEGLVGGAGNDVIVGNGTNNTLFGQGANDAVYGGGGNDNLNGGAGSDNLWGGAGADAHYGGTDGGIDYARYDDANYGNLTIRLDGGANVGAAAVGDTYSGIEGLVGGAGNDVIVGNGTNNWLFGSGGVDFLYGQLGNDYLNGGAGADRFVFNTALGAGNIDTIADFTHLVDDIILSSGIFTAIGASLTVDEFRVGVAVDANDFILYNSTTGALTYDSNGNAAGGAIRFATLDTGMTLTFDDFIVF